MNQTFGLSKPSENGTIITDNLPASGVIKNDQAIMPSFSQFFLRPRRSSPEQPTPAPTADTDVVKISTNLIQVDVTVTDGRGKIVHGLEPEDFENL